MFKLLLLTNPIVIISQAQLRCFAQAFREEVEEHAKEGLK